MGAIAGEAADLPESVVAEMRRVVTDLLADVSSYADDMLGYILERVPQARR